MSAETCLINHAPFEADKSLWMHVCPLGEHPWTSADGQEKIIQVIDNEACRLMAEHYPLSGPESRIDVDHKSMNPQHTTESSGWGKQAEVRGDGLWVRAEMTPIGQPLVQGKVYRFNSPCFPRHGLVRLDGNRFRVTRLGVIALTNDPNLRGQQPLTNSRTHAANPHTNTHPHMDYKSLLLKVLGLPAEASDDQINAACSSSAADKAAMNSRITELGDLLANRDLDEHGITDAEQRKLLTPSLTNTATRPAALALLAKGKATTEPKPPIHNRGNTGTPKVEALSQPEDAANDAGQARAAWIGNRARELAQTSNRRHTDCFAQAEAEHAQKFPATK